MTDDEPSSWWWRAVCTPCLEFRHEDCLGWVPGPDGFLCICEVERCTDRLIEEE